MTLRIAALTTGTPSVATLWMLRRLADTAHALTVVDCAAAGRRAAGAWPARVLEGRFERRTRERLGRLFAEEDLRRWYARAPLGREPAPPVDDVGCVEVLRRLEPDIILRAPSGALPPRLARCARRVALGLEHGPVPGARGIAWGLVEERPDWIGATVQVLDPGAGTLVLRRVRPQIAVGDDAHSLFFRAHLLAVDALVEVIGDLHAGRPLTPIPSPPAPPGGRSPGLRDWVRVWWLADGRHSPLVRASAVRCD